jgi:hypothetical protein
MFARSRYCSPSLIQPSPWPCRQRQRQQQQQQQQEPGIIRISKPRAALVSCPNMASVEMMWDAHTQQLTC